MKNTITLIAFLLGVISAVAAGAMYQSDTVRHLFTKDTHTHQTSAVHYHSDLAIFIDGEQLDLSADRYMSDNNQLLSKSVHLHDNNDDVIHFHDDGITLTTFLTSIGLTLSTDCLTLTTEETYCATADKTLAVVNNGELVADFLDFVPADGDRILIYYGDASESLERYMKQVSTDACIYSLTCPEKGTPPPESCGLTCEL